MFLEWICLFLYSKEASIYQLLQMQSNGTQERFPTNKQLTIFVGYQDQCYNFLE